jgi:DNA-binding NtrC family response regulator
MPKILMVEDDPDIQLLWSDCLVEADHQVDMATTVEAGCLLVRSRHYDLVIADGRLPDGIGLAIADVAREHGIPTIIITGYASMLRAVSDIASYRILLKPIRPNELLETVNSILAEVSALGPRGPAP